MRGRAAIARLGEGLGAVNPRARHAHKRALAAHRQVLARPFDHRSSIGRAHRPGLLAKKNPVRPSEYAEGAGVELGRLALALLLAIPEPLAPRANQARRIVENLLLPGA